MYVVAYREFPSATLNYLLILKFSDWVFFFSSFVILFIINSSRHCESSERKPTDPHFILFFNLSLKPFYPSFLFFFLIFIHHFVHMLHFHQHSFLPSLLNAIKTELKKIILPPIDLVCSQWYS